MTELFALIAIALIFLGFIALGKSLGRRDRRAHEQSIKDAYSDPTTTSKETTNG